MTELAIQSDPDPTLVIHDGNTIHRIPARELRFARRNVDGAGVHITYQLVGGPDREIVTLAGGDGLLWDAIKRGITLHLERRDRHDAWREKRVTEVSP